MKITVAVPTIAGRSKYLVSCLATCVSQDVDDLEILVSDNSEGDAQEVVASLADERVRYVRPPHYLPMSSHWDYVLENAAGDVITIIGDDDGLMPGSLSRVAEIHREVGAVPIHHSLCNYYWPDYHRDSERNTVVFFHEPNHECRWIDSREYLAAVANGSARYVDGPMIYHNFIPLQLVRRLSSRGVFFRRAAPDIYSALAIAANTERFFSLGECLTISGQGARATGASVRSGGVDGRKFATEMQAASLFTPRFRSRTVQLALVDSILEVDEQCSSNDLGDSIDYGNHLWLALHETMGMPNGWSKANEVVEILQWALRKKVLFELSSRVVSKGVNKVARAITSRPPFGTSTVRKTRGFVNQIRLDSSVQDIYAASLAVDAVLRTGLLVTDERANSPRPSK